jgi:uncharacterized membrane protein YidH (DUF202 family)
MLVGAGLIAFAVLALLLGVAQWGDVMRQLKRA